MDLNRTQIIKKGTKRGTTKNLKGDILGTTKSK